MCDRGDTKMMYFSIECHINQTKLFFLILPWYTFNSVQDSNVVKKLSIPIYT